MNQHKRDPGREKRLPAIDMALAFILIVFCMQIWLLTASLEAWLGGDEPIAMPAMLVSVASFLINARLLKYILNLDR